jgi:hypothetical protein
VSENLSGGGRLQIGIIALVFFGPLILATWMYSTGRLQPAARTNHGELLLPIVELEAFLSNLEDLKDTQPAWRLLYMDMAECDAVCTAALHRQRQILLMLGKEMNRVSRLFLHGSGSADKVSRGDEDVGLITINNKGLAELLEAKRPSEIPAGGIFLINPLDNLIMYFSPDLTPGDIANDLRYLLELSSIG